MGFMDKNENFLDSLSSFVREAHGVFDSPYARMLRLMCDNVPDLLWAKDLNNRFLFVNQAMCDKLLCARDTNEPIGKTDMFFALRERKNHPEQPDWHTFGEICRDSDLVVRQTGQAGRFDEFGNVRGEFLFLDVYKAPFRDEAGEIIGTVGCGRVVTDERRMVEALQEREEEYHRIVEQAASIIVKVDLSGQILFMNHFGLDLFGYTMDELYHKNAVGTIVSDKKNDDFFRKVPDQCCDGKTIEESVTRLGEHLYISWSNRPLYDTEGRCYGFLSIGNDVTDYKVRELELLEVRQRAASAELQKGVFLGTVTHELRTPLSGMLGVVDALLSSGRAPGVHEELSLLRDAAQTLLALVDDLVGVTNMNGFFPDINASAFHLGKDLVGPVRRLMEPLARAKGLKLEVRVAPGVPTLLLGDTLRLRQIFYNLIGNAVKYTDHGRVLFSVEQDTPLFPEKGRQALVFSVSDTGNGIPDDVQGTLFDFFTRSSSPDQQRREGSGLGLAVVKRIVDAMGGKIEVHSDPESGAMFRIHLDLMHPEQDASDEVCEDIPPLEKDDSQFLENAMPRILLADDNKLHRLSIGWALRDAGCRVVEARDGGEALAAAGAACPDAVILDIKMPGSEGVDLLQETRTLCSPDIPVLAVTAWISEEEQKKLLDSGYVAVLIKPVSRSRLYSCLAGALRTVSSSSFKEYGCGDLGEADYEALVDRFFEKIKLASGRDREYLKEMASLFVKEFPQLLFAFEKELSQTPPDKDLLCNRMHSMCNYVSAVGEGALAGMIRGCEEQLAAGLCSEDEFRRLIENLRLFHRIMQDRFSSLL